MKCKVERIMVFNKYGIRNSIKFNDGLNVISGQSQSGKSSLLEILDYCLCSTKSSIPVGKIDEFGYLFATVLRVEGKSILLARYNNKKRPDSMYLIRDTDFSYSNPIKSEIENYRMYTVKETKEELLDIFNIDVTDTTISSLDNQKKKGIATIRNMMSFLIQHQNLVASKFALFYRFDSNYKRKSTIEQFPVLMGWVDQEFYTYTKEAERLEKKKKVLERELNEEMLYVENRTKRLKEAVENYYVLGKIELDSEIFSDYSTIVIRLPEIKRSDQQSIGIVAKYEDYKQILANLRAKRANLETKIGNIDTTIKSTTDYDKNLLYLAERSEINNLENVLDTCPICNSKTDINESIQELVLARVKLNSELNSNRVNTKLLSQKKANLLVKLGKLNSEIDLMINKVNEIEKLYNVLLNEKEESEAILYAKARILSEVENQKQNSVDAIKNKINLLDEEIEKYKDLLDKYNFESKLNSANKLLNKIMNRMKYKLDIEEEFKKYNMVLDIKNDFDFYFSKDKNGRGKVSLSELGSGANWLSCHLAVFLGFLHLNLKIESSRIPSFLFLDQPSQVYFPRGQPSEYNDEGYRRVKKLYEFLIEEVELIEEETGDKPQLIVVDQVEKIPNLKYDLSNYIIAKWFNKKKFINEFGQDFNDK